MSRDRVLAPVFLFFLALSSTARATPAPSGDLAVRSPDGRLALAFAAAVPAAGGALIPCYRVAYQGRLLLDFSPLGFELQGDDYRARRFDRGFALTGAEDRHADETWPFSLGKASRIRDHYNELTVHLREVAAPFRALDVIFRAYDDGVAFRYVLPAQGNLGRFVIAEELTGFSFTADHLVYAQRLPSFRSSYDHPYRPARIRALHPATLIGLPLLVEMGDLWVALTEADLTDYAGMYLLADGRTKDRLRCRLAPHLREPDAKVLGATPFVTPWRVIMVGETVGDLLESNIVLNLNDPCAIGDTSWIRPGKAVWPWWSGSAVTGVDFKGGMNTGTFLHYLDFAAEAGLEYLLIDAGWYSLLAGDITGPVKSVDLPRIVAYARERGIGVLLWLDWARAARQMDRAFPLYERWGIAGVKLDYLHRDDQEMIRFCHAVLRKAAEHHLVVSFHGTHKPTGVRRTYPHLLTQEGVRGLEFNKWTRWCDPGHDVMLAFTRLLAGEMDFTPGGFTNVTRAEFRPSYRRPMAMGTRAHQLAMYVVYESPLQMCADYPGAYRGAAGFEFLQAVPTVWDETRVIVGSVGTLVVIARRKGVEWYVGGMTDWTPREVRIPLDFLPDGRYRAEVFADGDDAGNKPTSLVVTHENVASSDAIAVRMEAGGGVAIRIAPEDHTVSRG